MGSSPAIRRCRCGTRLARHNPGNVCAACLHAHDRFARPPRVPHDFWQQDTMREALDSRHIGKVIAAYRLHPWHARPIAQETVAGWLGIGQSRLSRIENGPPLRDIDRLVELADLFQIPATLLWFTPPGQPARALIPDTGHSGHHRNRELLDALDRTRALVDDLLDASDALLAAYERMRGGDHASLEPRLLRLAALRAAAAADTQRDELPGQTGNPASTVEDMDRKQFLMAALGVGAGAAATHPLAELLAPTAPTPVASVIGQKEIGDVLAAKQMFSTLDHVHGGGAVRQAMAAQLRHCAALLDARCPEKLRPELYFAVGRFGTSAGFAVFDDHAHDDARRMFRFALACADEVEDWQLRATVLSDMARQAWWLGDYDESLSIADSALVRADRLTPRHRAMLHAARARALARLGRVQEALAAIGVADEEFHRPDPAPDSGHLRWYNAAEHAAETGHALADLAAHGHSADAAAARLGTAVADFGDGYARSRAFGQIRLATLAMSTGDPRRAAEIGGQATAAAAAIRSRRITDELRGLGRAATAHAGIPEVAELRHRIAAATAT